jgi:hypothetical protein
MKRNHKESWQLGDYIRECCGEVAFAKAFRLEQQFELDNTLYRREGREFSNIVVRTYTEQDASLVVYPQDAADLIIVQVIQLGARDFGVVGWIKASDAKQQQWLLDHAYHVPQTALTLQDIFGAEPNSIEEQDGHK